MGWARFRRSWGIPWLGLPLGGVLALSGAAQLAWEGPRFGTTAAERAAVAAAGSTAAAELGLGPGGPPRRAADRSASLKPGQTLRELFNELGMAPHEIYGATRASERYVDPRQLRVGAPWSAYLGANGRLQRFEMVLPGRGELTLERVGGQWQPAWRKLRRESRVRAIRGTLEGALESSMARAGAAPELAYLLADVLQWDLDFSRDLRRHDEFRVLFEEVMVEGHEPRPERVLAVSYAHAEGRALEAFLFGSATDAGYFDGEGKPLQKMFLRSPMPYSRVTSKFSNRRFHPVLGVFRPHHGIDYGAPTGTPVRVTASGAVVEADWSGGGGKTVKVRHPNGYLTAYLHLSRFARGIRPGARVRQGDVIGYVGATGLATAPHLDYRIQVHGRWIDPMTLAIVPAEPVPSPRRAEFLAVRDAMRASLETGELFRPPAISLARGSAGAGPAHLQPEPELGRIN